MRKAPDGGNLPFGAEAYFDKEAKGMEEQDKKIMTNGDRIRAMDDAALAELLGSHNIVCDYDREWCEKRTSGCRSCTKEWLMAEART